MHRRQTLDKSNFVQEAFTSADILEVLDERTEEVVDMHVVVVVAWAEDILAEQEVAAHVPVVVLRHHAYPYQKH